MLTKESIITSGYSENAVPSRKGGMARRVEPLMTVASMVFRSRAVRMRDNILRGVLDDNLRLIGKHGPLRIGSGLTLPRKVLLATCLAFVMVVVHGTFLSVTWFPERQIRAGHLVSPAATVRDVPVPEGTFRGEEYQALIRNDDIPLWKLLGLQVRTIMIDPGHGGKDTGAIGRAGSHEKDLALDIALRLRERLERNDRYRVVMTRQDDRTVSLNDRVSLAASRDADIFVSIHLNYLPKKPLNIIETFYFGPTTDGPASRLAEQENAGSEIGLSEFRAMVEKINDSLKQAESKKLARDIQKSLYASSSEKDSSIVDYGTKTAPFVVLLGVDVPSVLVEVSCLSNRQEEKKLNTENHREDIARYLEAGILDYLSKGETPYVASKQ